MKRWDVIIAGGGYAGLAAAVALGSRALVIDQHEIGAVQRSACAVPVTVVDRFGATDSILQRYDNAYFHDPRGTHRFPLNSPYCIIDHCRFCRSLWERSDATFTKARIRKVTSQTVSTSAGDFDAPLFIDATGWPGVLISQGRSASDRTMRLTVGVEADVPGRAEGLHFYYVPEIVPKGYAWVFPAGNELRIGIGSYDRDLNVRESIRQFLQYLGLDGKPSRGGMIPWFSSEPVVGNVFAAGDAAGHCLPLTAEGIRLALGFGDAAGNVLRRVIDGEIRLDQASMEYRAMCSEHRRSFKAMQLSQSLIGTVPDIGIHLVARTLARPRISPRFLRAYFSLGAETGRAA